MNTNTCPNPWDLRYFKKVSIYGGHSTLTLRASAILI